MRIHDVEPLESQSSPISRYRGPIILFAIIAAMIAFYAAWYFTQDDEEEEETTTIAIGPLTTEKLREHLTESKLKQSETFMPFEEADSVRDFARKSAHGKASDREKAEALVDTIREFLDADHQLYISIEPRSVPPLSPAKTLEALSSDEPFQPYSYELATLLVTSCRSLGIPAVLAEVYQFESEQRPADSSGTQGYFVAAIPRTDGGSYNRPLLYDPVSGRSGDTAQAQADVLTDVEAVSAWLSLQALYETAQEGDTTQGERLATAAVKLRPASASARATRGTVRLSGGGGELSAQSALEDYQKAMHYRPDPQRKVLLARISLALQQPTQAEKLVRSALEETPEFGAAHGLLGLILLQQQNLEEAEAEFTLAEQFEPRDPHLPLLRVHYFMAQSDLESAAGVAQTVVDRVPDDPQPRLLLAKVLYEDGRYSEGDEQCRVILSKNPDNVQIRELVQLVGCDPSTLSESEAVAQADTSEDAGVAEGEDGDLPSYDLQMGQQNKNIGFDGFQLNPGGGASGTGGSGRFGGGFGLKLRPMSN